MSFTSFDSRTQLLKLFEGLLLVSLRFTEDTENQVDTQSMPSLESLTYLIQKLSQVPGNKKQGRYARLALL